MAKEEKEYYSHVKNFVDDERRLVFHTVEYFFSKKLKLYSRMLKNDISKIAILLFFGIALPVVAGAQKRLNKLSAAMTVFQADSQLQNADISLCILNSKDGKILYQKNKNLLLPPASTIKTFTTASALHYLGKDFVYTTKINFKGIILTDTAYGELIIYASGDPSFGSDRFDETKPLPIFTKIETGLRELHVKYWKGNIRVVNNVFTDSSSSKYWMDEDYGNYYGAGVFGLNWKENKFDLQIAPIGNEFVVKNNDGGLDNQKDFCLDLKEKHEASTEDAFAYVIKDSVCKYAIRGYLSGVKGLQTVSLARLHPDEDFKKDVMAYLKTKFKVEEANLELAADEINIATIESPPLSKLVYACNQKSLNLYAESFCKTIAYQNTHQGTWLNGIAEMKKFAKKLGVDEQSIQLLDASGLAPNNKINTFTLAKLLSLYKQQNWSSTFVESLPLINNITMKSGYIGGTRSYTGYMVLPNGTPISFAFIVHHFAGSPKTVKEKMFKLLDVLK